MKECTKLEELVETANLDVTGLELSIKHIWDFLGDIYFDWTGTKMSNEPQIIKMRRWNLSTFHIASHTRLALWWWHPNNPSLNRQKEAEISAKEEEKWRF